MKKKVKYNDYEVFYNKYFTTGEFPHMRFGQAFISDFNISGSFPEIFYESNNVKVIKLVLETFVDFN